MIRTPDRWCRCHWLLATRHPCPAVTSYFCKFIVLVVGAAPVTLGLLQDNFDGWYSLKIGRQLAVGSRLWCCSPPISKRDIRCLMFASGWGSFLFPLATLFWASTPSFTTFDAAPVKTCIRQYTAASSLAFFRDRFPSSGLLTKLLGSSQFDPCWGSSHSRRGSRFDRRR